MKFDSDEEEYFSWWLDELKKKSFIKEYIRNHKSLPLSDMISVQYGNKGKTTTLLSDHVYTTDFIITVDKYSGLFADQGNLPVSPNSRSVFMLISEKPGSKHYHIEVKPDFDSNNMTRLFRLNQKWVYQKHGIYTNLVKVPSLFKKTFVPQKYMFTPVKKKPRKFKYEVLTCSQYVEKVV